MTDSQGLSQLNHDDEIDLRELFGVLWDGKWLIGGVSFAVAIIAVIVTLMMPNVYRAEALLAPSHEDRAGVQAMLAAQYGGLASLAGINLPSQAQNKVSIGLEVIKSRKFITDFIERHDILVPLMAAKDWNAESGELEIDSDDYDVIDEKWIRKVSPPRKTIPSMQEAYEEFMELLSVSEDKKSGFITVAVEHYSPVVAKQWVDWLVEDINSTIMQHDVDEAEEAITYLNEQIKKTSVSELQNVFFRLIEEQTKTVMLANVTDEYLLQTLDPAVAPEWKVKPRRALILILAFLAGGFLGVAVQIARRGGGL